MREKLSLWVVAAAFVSMLAGSNSWGASSGETASLQGTLFERRSSGLNLGAGPGIAMLGNELGWGINVTLDRKMSEEHPFYVGIDFGAHQWQGLSSTGPLNRFRTKVHDSEIVSLQLLSSFYYRFSIPNFRAVSPYLGMSLGPNIVLSRGNVVNTTSTDAKVWVHESNVYAELLIRPGFNVSISPAFGLNVETKFGWLGTAFVFLPQFNASILL